MEEQQQWAVWSIPNNLLAPSTRPSCPLISDEGGQER